MTSARIGRPLCHCRRHVGAAVTAGMAAAMSPPLSPPLPPSPLPLPLPWLSPSPPPPAPFPLLLLPLFGFLQCASPSKNPCHRVLSATPRHFCKKNRTQQSNGRKWGWNGGAVVALGDDGSKSSLGGGVGWSLDIVVVVFGGGGRRTATMASHRHQRRRS